jgi:hypothetical protein
MGQQGAGARRDAYSVVLFCQRVTNILVNDFTRTPDQLLDTVLAEQPSWGTNFSGALGAARAIMEEYWSAERLVSVPASSYLFLWFPTTQDARHDLPFRRGVFVKR